MKNFLLFLITFTLCISSDLIAATFTNGMVSSAHPLATQAGLNVLKSGGNAIDAAVAVGLTLGVVDGHNSGIGGETRRFRPLVDIYREMGKRAGFKPEQLKVGVHALGYVAATTKEAVDDFFPGYAQAFTKVGKERGWPPVTRSHFDSLIGPHGALLVGNPDEVAEKILNHSEALGGISRISFQMDVAALPNAKLMEAINIIGTRVAPLLKRK